jgi:RNA polymerase sigma-70 factor (ECF subfamily)
MSCLSEFLVWARWYRVKQFGWRWYDSPATSRFSTVLIALKVPQMSDAHSVTLLLEQWNHGDREALDKLMPLIYEELRKMAKRYMSQQNPGHTLQTTALIHEAYLRMVKQKEKHFENRAHFFGVAAQAMRHILVDYARERHTAKRGGGARPISLEEAALVTPERAAELVAFDEALKELERLSKRQSRVVELRYFGGLTVEETATVLKVSPETVMRDWTMAKTWLHRALMPANEV